MYQLRSYEEDTTPHNNYIFVFSIAKMLVNQCPLN